MKKLASKLILGTVQFGLDYGINNTVGKPTLTEVFGILDLARQAGVGLVDTARAYGDAEERLGQYFTTRSGAEDLQVITKLHPADGEDWRASFAKSIEVLKKTRLYALLFHSFGDFIAHRNLLPAIQALREEGAIAHLGVSVYTNNEIEQLLSEPAVDIIQLPFNLLDNEQLRGDLLRRAKANGKIIHTRSVFLQGLFFKPLSELPASLLPLRPALNRLRDIAATVGVNMATLALQYCASRPFIDGVLIGVDTQEQCRANLASLAQNLDPAVFEDLPLVERSGQPLLNPALW